MTQRNIIPDIIFEDNCLIVARKPAGMAVQSRKVTSMDLENWLLNYLAGKNKITGGKPYLAVINRLDQPVEGLVLFAKTKDAAKNLSSQLQNDKIQKEYLAVIEGKPERKEGTLEDYLVKDEKNNISCISDRNTPGAKRAVLHYEILPGVSEIYPESHSEVLPEILPEPVQKADEGEETAAQKTRAAGKSTEEHREITGNLVRIQLQTGRHHQIRVQMSHAGMPLFGDRKYNPGTAGNTIALCASRLLFRHPQSGRKMEFKTFPEGEGFRGFFSRRASGK
ncbi:MAG: RluA family pseudouridine synthase [Blautia sp.]|nr:RluA family pseudouridine synthase [Blautia sp.]